MTIVWRHVAVWVVFGLVVGVASGETPPPLARAWSAAAPGRRNETMNDER
jgi:hypothetical protein